MQRLATAGPGGKRAIWMRAECRVDLGPGMGDGIGGGGIPSVRGWGVSGALRRLRHANLGIEKRARTGEITAPGRWRGNAAPTTYRGAGTPDMIEEAGHCISTSLLPTGQMLLPEVKIFEVPDVGAV